jgi:hypothetical protein
MSLKIEKDWLTIINDAFAKLRDDMIFFAKLLIVCALLF